MKNRKNNRRSNRGTSLIEMLAGAIFFIPIALTAVDLISLSMAEQVNDNVARDAARAAANQTNQGDARTAADRAVAMYSSNALVSKVMIDKFDYSNGVVNVVTHIDARVPAPVAGFGAKRLVANSFQPIVGVAADL